MDRKYIDDHHIVARYLADQLPEPEREAFEAYFLEHPEMVQEMEAAARFKAGLMHLRDTGELSNLLSPTRRMPWRRLAALAALVAGLAIGVGYLVRDANDPPTLASTVVALGYPGESLMLANTHLIVRVRGTADAEIELPDSDSPVALRVLPEFEAQPPRYRVSVSRLTADGSTRGLGEIAGLSPDEEGYVAVYLRSANINAGRYQLEVAGDEGTDAVGQRSTFSVDMRRTDRRTEADTP